MSNDILGTKCQDCGYIHPVPENGICPLSSAKNVDIGSNKKEDFTEFIDKINKICISQIKMKNIKNIENVKNFVILEVVKAFESYKE